jgi:hypothetical protein
MTTIKEEIFEYLKEMGLMPKYDNDQDIVFKYQMATLIIVFHDKDKQFIRVILPNIFRVDENNRSDVLEVCNEIALHIKVAKCYITPHNKVWLAVEILLEKTPKYEDFLPRSFRILLDAALAFKKEINK